MAKGRSEKSRAQAIEFWRDINTYITNHKWSDAATAALMDVTIQSVERWKFQEEAAPALSKLSAPWAELRRTGQISYPDETLIQLRLEEDTVRKQHSVHAKRRTYSSAKWADDLEQFTTQFLLPALGDPRIQARIKEIAPAMVGPQVRPPTPQGARRNGPAFPNAR